MAKSKYDRLANRPILKDKDRAKIAARMTKKYSPGVFVVVDTKRVKVRASGEAFAQCTDATAVAGEYGKNHEVYQLRLDEKQKPTLEDIPIGG